MAELLLVANPSKRRRRKKSARSRRRKGRIPPGLRAYMERTGKLKRHRRRRKSTTSRRRRRSHAVRVTRRRRRRASGGVRRPAVGYTVGTRRIRRRKLNPHRRRFHRRRHNPSLRGLTGAIMPTFKAGAWGATGGLTLDVLWGLIYPRVAAMGSIGPMLANPYVGFFAKGVAAVGAGWLGGKVFRGRGRQLAEGAMTIVVHDFLKSTLMSMMPSVFGTGGSLPLGMYLSGLGGAAPILGSTVPPQTYMPFGQYMSGGTGSNDTHGVYDGDLMGEDGWSGDYGNS